MGGLDVGRGGAVARGDHRFESNYGTLYPALLKLEQEGLIASSWGVSDNNRKAKFYKLTRAGKKQIERDIRQWEETSAIMTRFLEELP